MFFFHLYAKQNILKLNFLLNDFLDVFNYEKPPKGNKYFGSDEEGMECDCPLECETIEYGIEISPVQKKNM